MADEREGFVVHPAWSHYFWQIVAAFLLVGAGVWLATQKGGDRNFLHIGLGSFALAAFLAVYVLAARRATRFSATPTRLIEERGLFIKSSRELLIRDVRSIEVDRPLPGALLGVGTVTFSSAASADGTVRFGSVWRPGRLRDRVRAIQDGVLK